MNFYISYFNIVFQIKKMKERSPFKDTSLGRAYTIWWQNPQGEKDKHLNTLILFPAGNLFPFFWLLVSLSQNSYVKPLCWHWHSKGWASFSTVPWENEWQQFCDFPSEKRKLLAHHIVNQQWTSYYSSINFFEHFYGLNK